MDVVADTVESPVDVEGRIVLKEQGDTWLPLDTAPFSTWILLLWCGGLIPHYEITMGTIVINQDFKRVQFWNGYEYRPMDKVVGWHPLPAVPDILDAEYISNE